jgi:hypothetical protein
MHDPDPGWRQASQPRAGEQLVGDERADCSGQTLDPLAAAFEAELATWLDWLDAVRSA